MPPRSHAEAQEARYAELVSIDAEEVREALLRVSELFCAEGGEVYEPILERLRDDWEAIEEARERMARAKRDAAAYAAALKTRRRSSAGSRGGAPG